MSIVSSDLLEDFMVSVLLRVMQEQYYAVSIEYQRNEDVIFSIKAT